MAACGKGWRQAQAEVHHAGQLVAWCSMVYWSTEWAANSRKFIIHVFCQVLLTDAAFVVGVLKMQHVVLLVILHQLDDACLDWLQRRPQLSTWRGELPQITTSVSDTYKDGTVHLISPGSLFHRVVPSELNAPSPGLLLTRGSAWRPVPDELNEVLAVSLFKLQFSRTAAGWCGQRANEESGRREEV